MDCFLPRQLTAASRTPFWLLSGCELALPLHSEHCQTTRRRVHSAATGERMRRGALVAILGVSIVVGGGVPANGCGDKLLVLGRASRLEALLGNRTAKILAYQHTGTHGADLIADPEFQSAIKNAGYQLRIVRDTEELEVALRLGKYDLLISDITDTSMIQPTVLSAANTPALIPILYQPTKTDLASV